MLTVETLREYLNLPPDEGDAIAELCLNAAKSRAKAAGIPVKTGKYLTGANGKCLIEGTESGYVKLVTDGASGRILGAQLVCPRATDMVGELTLAIQKGLTADDLSAVIHPHPTFSEMLFGAAEGLRLE